GSGKEALAALASEAFDVVLMDVQMPEMDGFEATAAIRERERETGGRIPILALTAHAMKGDRERCLAGGMDGYLAKPIEAQELYDAVEGLASGSPPAEAKEVEASAQSALFDQEGALRRTGGSREVLQELVKLFLKESPRLMQSIRDAIAHSDGAELQHAAHTLKGSAGVVGAESTVDAAWTLECMGEGGDLGGVDQAWALLERQLEQLVPALTALAERSGGDHHNRTGR
ncbi:MAG: response regulator, partial [Planctomycetota bacterium]